MSQWFQSSANHSHASHTHVSHTHVSRIYNVLLVLVSAFAIAGCALAYPVVPAGTTWAPAAASAPAPAAVSTTSMPEYIAVYEGSYGVIVRNLRFVRVGHGNLYALAVDLVYNNYSPFLARTERNSRLHAQVFDAAGKLVGEFDTGSSSMQPGAADTYTIGLGTAYRASLYAGKRFAVKFTDAGGNPLGQLSAVMSVAGIR